jgi:hypothetical protein
VDPQHYHDLMRQLTAIRANLFRWIAKQDPTLTSLKRVLEQDRAIQQMDVQSLRDFCAHLEAKYGVDNSPGK